MDTAATPAGGLEAAFRRIEATRMAGVPILNPALSVAAVGLRRHGPDFVTVLVTPWFMNLVIVPAEARTFETAEGGTVRRRFPSGEFDFMTLSEPEVGPFAMCSLFSPMAEFGDQATAVATAAAALDEAMREDTPADAAAIDDRPALPPAARSRRAFLGLGREGRP